MPKPRKNYDAAVELYRGGASIEQVAATFGVSRQSMHMILKRRQVKFRPQLRTGAENHFFREGKPYDARVRQITMNAIQSGRLVPPLLCESCSAPGSIAKDGRSLLHAHHDDYNKPLNVRWLCQRCHFQWHAHNHPIRRTVALPPMAKRQIAQLGGRAAWRARERAERQLKAAREARRAG